VIPVAGSDVGVIGCGNALGDRFEMIGCRDVGLVGTSAGNDLEDIRDISEPGRISYNPVAAKARRTSQVKVFSVSESIFMGFISGTAGILQAIAETVYLWSIIGK
jgi:hypothetical protein